MGSTKKTADKASEHARFGGADLQDMAKLGGQFLKKTVASGIEAFKEVKEAFPKEASQFIHKSKEEILKTFTQEGLRNVSVFAVDKLFAAIRQHRLEISVRIKKVDDEAEAPSTKKSGLTRFAQRGKSD